MRKIAIFLLITLTNFGCKEEVKIPKVTSGLPDIVNNASNLKGIDLDLAYKNVGSSNNFYQSNAVRVLQYIYQNRKTDTKSYEMAEDNISFINWNKEEEILFVNFGSDQMCYAGYFVFYGATLDKINSMAKEKMSLGDGPFSTFYEARLKRETDPQKEKSVVDKYLNTNSCKP